MQRTTNTDLALMIGGLRSDIKAVMAVTDKLDKALNGNGKRGLIEDHRCLENTVTKHIDEANAEKKAASDKKDKVSSRTWAVLMLILGAFITQATVWVFLFLRTGAIK